MRRLLLVLLGFGVFAGYGSAVASARWHARHGGGCHDRWSQQDRFHRSDFAPTAAPAPAPVQAPVIVPAAAAPAPQIFVITVPGQAPAAAPQVITVPVPVQAAAAPAAGTTP